MKTNLMLSIAAIAATAAFSGVAQADVVKIYNWSDYIAEDTLENFTAETGIEKQADAQ